MRAIKRHKRACEGHQEAYEGIWGPSGAPSLTWSTAKAVHQEQASPLSSCHQGFVSQEPAAGGAWSLCFSLANWPNVHNTWPQPKLERNQMTLHQCLFSFKCLAISTWEDHCCDKNFSTLLLQKCTLGKVSVLPSSHFLYDHLILGLFENIANQIWRSLNNCPKNGGQVKVRRRIGANPEQMFRTEI